LQEGVVVGRPVLAVVHHGTEGQGFKLPATAVTAVTAGGEHTCAIKLDGSAWCWGWNGHGQLGDGTGLDRYVDTRLPSSVGGYTPVDITAGEMHTCAALALGETLCWGSNHYRQIGDGTNILRDVPTTIL